MSLAKNFYNKAVPTRNLISTITGVVVLLISGLALFGILTQEQATSLTQYVTTIVTAVAGIISIFKLTDGQ
jgi:hypothetical protein